MIPTFYSPEVELPCHLNEERPRLINPPAD